MGSYTAHNVEGTYYFNGENPENYRSERLGEEMNYHELSQWDLLYFTTLRPGLERILPYDVSAYLDM